MKNILYLIMFTGLFFFGCDSHDQAISEKEIPTIAVTQWTDKMEIFMEHDAAVAGEEIKFVIHLTHLSDFQPVRKGKVILNFKTKSGPEISLEKNELLREGIFTPTNTFQTAGNYDFNLQYLGADFSESFAIGTFTVHTSAEEIPALGNGSTVEEISFLKEQQWKMDFATEQVQLRKIKSGVHAIGKVKPQPASYAEIVSPVEGIISIAAAKQLVKPGQKVKKGQTLAVLLPPLSAQNSWAEIYLNYEQAKAEFERAKRLKERNAISGREYETAKRNYELYKAGIANYFGSEGGSLRFDSQNQQFHIIAPIAGYVSDVTILPGQNVNRAQKLFSIVNPSIVWLRMELYADQIKKIDHISSASITIPGNEHTVQLDQNNMKLISRGEVMDPRKQTITLWLEVDNKNRDFIIGQTISAQIYTGLDQDMLTVPISAVYDDNSQKVIYIHTGGESFEKRELTTGPTYHNYVGVLSGLVAGERIVSRGGYLVKLASTSEAIGHGHTH
jgi:cobalt-zinc-cadmium efflux system membrane fusion protein